MTGEQGGQGPAQAKTGSDRDARIQTMVIFGASGDLTSRKLDPAPLKIERP